MYAYFAPPLNTPGGGAPATGTPADFAVWDGVNRLARFTVNADNTINLASETLILNVPDQPGHVLPRRRRHGLRRGRQPLPVHR